MDLEREEVIDFTGEDFNKNSIPCSVGLLIIFGIALINLILMFTFPGTYISVYISLVIIIVFVLYYSYVLSRNPGKIRKFIISHEEIILILPSTPTFNITWSEFKQIEIRMSTFSFKPYCRYEFHFISEKFDKSFDLCLFDFHKTKIKEILGLTKLYAKKMNKDFRSVKETNVSGVILLEDFKI